MDKEKILLDALNTFGNFTSVEEEFNSNQLEVIYEAMDQVLDIANVVGQTEQLVCDNHHADLEHFMNYSESICKTCKQKV